MKKTVSFMLVALLLLSIPSVSRFNKPFAVEISTDVGDYRVVLTDNDLISLPPLELDRQLKALIEDVAAGTATPFTRAIQLGE